MEDPYAFLEEHVTKRRVAVALVAGAGIFLTYRYLTMESAPETSPRAVIKESKRITEREDARQRFKARRKRRTASSSGALVDSKQTAVDNLERDASDERSFVDSASIMSESTTNSAVSPALADLPVSKSDERFSEAHRSGKNDENVGRVAANARRLQSEQQSRPVRLDSRSTSQTLPRNWVNNHHNSNTNNSANRNPHHARPGVQQARTGVQRQGRLRTGSTTEKSKDSKMFFEMLQLYGGIAVAERESPRGRSPVGGRSRSNSVTNDGGSDSERDSGNPKAAKGRSRSRNNVLAGRMPAQHSVPKRATSSRSDTEDDVSDYERRHKSEHAKGRNFAIATTDVSETSDSSVGVRLR